MNYILTTERMIGATILDIQAVDQSDRIEFVRIITDKGVFHAEAEGDCCAYAWIDEVAGTDSVIGGTILGVSTNDEKHDLDNGDKYGVLDSFVEVVSTTKGDFAMFTFCEHNGYYSGWINWTM